ncbi:phage portal protein [Bythopirellula polymerisocia]|uniref:Phage portal protein, lambda family n=1 Tax=Bythopirellula polymerisocia TaxID=2528003 RepID=A0A5C6D035_9BACT|nr:phage portal protein [Bythopirellula polymerisocia]TWU30220.1 Phage portal protein, lambda family [Bythopirellula polymerisocia]
MSNTTRLERRLTEACDALWDLFVDPRDAYLDDTGQWWDSVATNGHAGPGVSVPFATEAQLADIRNQVRHLAATNEFAINGIENRVSYLVGTGHVYRACVRKGSHASGELETDVQAVIDEFLEVNHWQSRQQEIVRRLDRDGEAFLRYFVDSHGITRVRFVEPAQVATPRELQNVPEASFGIHTEPHDVESVLGYYLDGQPIDAAMIQHRKANVDANVKRGLPLYYPVRKNLRRIDKLLRNMSVVAEIQSAIALIRKHRGASRSGVEQFVADQSQTTSAGSRTRQLSHYAPGTILDAPAGLEYDFPAAGIDASNFVAVLQAELRAVAARLVMPEFMFTSDASNSNYASTLVAEGPAVKMFQRLQAGLETDDRDVMWRAVENAALAGRLPNDIRRLVDIQITPPSLEVRNHLQHCQVEKIAFEKGILSPQTWSLKLGLDYDQEQKNLAMHQEEIVGWNER